MDATYARRQQLQASNTAGPGQILRYFDAFHPLNVMHERARERVFVLCSNLFELTY